LNAVHVMFFLALSPAEGSGIYRERGQVGLPITTVGSDEADGCPIHNVGHDCVGDGVPILIIAEPI